LTNVMRHAGANASATVTVRHAADEVRVEVVDDGRGAASAVDSPHGGGHGIAGMSERAVTVGGSVVAGPHPGGGFRVVARLPLSGAAIGTSP
jgi:signal transduction histidine kinase